MLKWLGKLFGGTRQEQPPRGDRRRLSARYEAELNTNDTAPLWQMTDYLSAKAANSYPVRRTLKIRSRYEAANNSYFRGMIDTWAEDLIGTGPVLQMRGPSAVQNKAIETRWHEWCKEVGFAEKLTTMAKGKLQDGEGFAVLVNNPQLEAVQTDLNVIESDQVTTPAPGFTDPYWVDGIILDKLGNPKSYQILKSHPGDLFFPHLNPMDFDNWKPALVCQWFKIDRPGQVRGIPEICPSLELFGKLRRYTKAVLDAAETAADFAAVLESEAPANDDIGSDVNAGLLPSEQIPIDRGVLTTLPFGYKLSQMTAAQPSTQYEMFVRVLIREISRCLRIPLNIALGDSSGYNYSSGRLDHLQYHRGQRISRRKCESSTAEKTFVQWYAEAILIPGYLPTCPPVPPARRWFWNSAESIDPVKDATADGMELANGTRTLADIYAERGEDWEQKIQQRGKEVALCNKLGLTPPPPPTTPTAPGQPKAGGAAPPAKAAPAKPPAKASWKRKNRLRAEFDEADHPRDEQGQFSEGGGGSGTEKELNDEAENALSDRQQGEQDELSDRHGEEESSLDEKHDAEKEKAGYDDLSVDERSEIDDRQQGEKDTLEDKQTAEKDSLDERHAAEEASKSDMQERHGDERGDLEEKQSKEEDKLQSKQEKEADKLTSKHEKEDEKSEAIQDKEVERDDKKREREDAANAKAPDPEHDKAVKEARAKEDDAWIAKRDKENDERYERQTAESKALDEKHDAEQAALKQEHAKADKALSEKQRADLHQHAQRPLEASYHRPRRRRSHQRA